MTKIINAVMKVVEVIVTILFLISVILVICQVFWRYVLNDPISWTSQISRALFCWMTYLGIPILFNRNILMSFDLVRDSFKDAAGIWLNIIFRVIGLFFCICWFLFSIEFCKECAGQVFPGIPLPQNSLYGAQIVCCVLLFFVQVSQIVEYLKDLKELKKAKKEEVKA